MKAGRYHVEGDLLLDDYEWAGGIRPDFKLVEQRRKELDAGVAFTAPVVMRDALPIAVPAGYDSAMARAVEERSAKLVQLRLESRMTGLGSGDNLALFEHGRQGELI